MDSPKEDGKEGGATKTKVVQSVAADGGTNQFNCSFEN